MTFLIFLVFCNSLNIQFESFKVILKSSIKVLSFIAFVYTTIYLFWEVTSGAKESLDKNNNRIKELEDKKDKIIDLFDKCAKPKEEWEKPEEKIWPDKLWDFQISCLTDCQKEQRSLSIRNIELWKWKIGTLITLNATFILIAKFF